MRKKTDRRKYKKRCFRRLRWLGAWMLVIMIFTLAGGIVFWTISGIRNVCESVLAKQVDEEDMLSLEDSSAKRGKQQSDKEEQSEQKNDISVLYSLEEDDDIDPETLLVNKSVYLPTDYEISLTSLKNGQEVASMIYGDLKEMLTDGEKEGCSFLVASGFRSSETQKKLLAEEIEKNQLAGMSEEEARQDALLTVAPAHYSEHETGLAVDIVAVSNQRMDETQEQTTENQWLQENCQRYGFILRYPKGKEEITGFSYEA